MKVEFTHKFIKIYKRRFSSNQAIKERFDQRTRLFVTNPQNPVLKDHQLGGKLQGYRAFSITGDIRVVYYAFEDIAYFIDIGTHNQIYGK